MRSTKRSTGLRGLLASALMALGTPAPPASAVSFTGLGDLAGGSFSSWATAVSSDGSVVVGQGTSAAGDEAFRWTSAGGMVGLGDLAGGPFESLANDVSGDGSVVVGEGTSIFFCPSCEAFRWTSGGGMVGLGALPSIANGVSGNGLVVVGVSDGEAFRWTTGGGMVGLGYLGGPSLSVARDVSYDGSVIAGFSGSVSGNQAFRWTSAGGMVGLGDLAGGSFWSVANGISDDGSVVVGIGTSASGNEAFRWTVGGGMVGLGDLEGGSFNSHADDVSGDGSVIVGSGNVAPGGGDAFIWDQANGMRKLDQVLIDLGMDLTGWKLIAATGISADGNTIVGFGTHTGFGDEAWIAVIPEPGTALTFGMGLVVLGWRGRAKRS